MIYRTPTDQAAAARGAHASRTRRVAARCRVLCADMKLRREVNQLCAESGMAAPFPDAYFAMGTPGTTITPTERKGMWRALEKIARKWV